MNSLILITHPDNQGCFHNGMYRTIVSTLTHHNEHVDVVDLYEEKVNSVTLRLVMGVYSCVFGWFRARTRQFWSVPLVSDSQRKKYLQIVVKDAVRDMRRSR